MSDPLAETAAAPPSACFTEQPQWPGDGTHRIPFVAYTSGELYRRELERFFYRGHWCYVGLAAEVPNATPTAG
jgi:salicylate 5-hydroxylase large subunit